MHLVIFLEVFMMKLPPTNIFTTSTLYSRIYDIAASFISIINSFHLSDYTVYHS